MTCVYQEVDGLDPSPVVSNPTMWNRISRVCQAFNNIWLTLLCRWSTAIQPPPVWFMKSPPNAYRRTKMLPK